MPKRLFLAADIDAATRDEIGHIAAELRARIGPHMKATWVHPERMHLTLQFFGNADAALEERVRGLVINAIPQQSFNLSFDGLGFFPERGAPRVLWLGIREGLAELRRVQQILARRDLARAREEAADRAFNPHLTLARFRHHVSRRQIVDLGDISAVAGPSRIDRVTLYESRLSPNGPTYLRLAEALLQT